MRLVTFEVTTPFGAQQRIGVLRRADGEVVDLQVALACMRNAVLSPELVDLPGDMISFLALGDAGISAAKAAMTFVEAGPEQFQGAMLVYARPSVRLLSPVPKPLTIREHSEWAEHGSLARSRAVNPPSRARRSFESPANLYNGNPLSVGGPEDPLIWPDYCERFDLEPELGFFIGKTGTNLSREEAESFIAGYTLFIDNSARDNQAREIEFMNFGYKGKDFHNIIGPCIVTPDEFNESSARAWITVNDELWWEYDIGDHRKFSSVDCVAFASDTETLYPGDFFGMGTIGTGAQIDLDRWVKPGDQFEFGIDGLGVLRHQVVRVPGSNVVRDGLRGNLKVPESDLMVSKVAS